MSLIDLTPNDETGEPQRGAWAARVVALAITGILLLWAVVLTVVIYGGAAIRGEVAWDANLYAAIGTHFLETGRAYFPSQSAPYLAEGIVNIYPPTALYLFVPASVLPRVLWWVVPIVVIGWSLYRLRPAWWGWPLMALGCVLPVGAPVVPVGLVYGNTLLWTVAALFAAAAFRPGVAWAVLFKPTDIILGLPFILRSRRGLIVAVAMSAILLPLWFDWLTAMQNIEGSSLLRNVASWPALAIPLLAWLSRRPVRPALRRRTGAESATVAPDAGRVPAPFS